VGESGTRFLSAVPGESGGHGCCWMIEIRVLSWGFLAFGVGILVSCWFWNQERTGHLESSTRCAMLIGVRLAHQAIL